MYGGINLLGPSQGHHVLRGSTKVEEQGALIFDAQGSQSSKGDFVFKRKDSTEKCKVEVEGELSVQDRLTSSKNKIELRSVEGEGWGFYLT